MLPEEIKEIISKLELFCKTKEETPLCLLMDPMLGYWVRNDPEANKVIKLTQEGKTAVAKAIIDIAVEKGKTNDFAKALRMAAKHGFTGVVSHLLPEIDRIENASVFSFFTRGTQVNSSDDFFDRTALHEAAENGYTDIVKLLLEHGAKTDKKDSKKQLPLHLAAMNGHNDVVKVLLEHGAQVDSEAENEQTALHFAAQYGVADVITTLLDHAAEPNKKTQKGDTALHLAAKLKRPEVVTPFLNHADITATDAQGNLPLSLMIETFLHTKTPPVCTELFQKTHNANQIKILHECQDPFDSANNQAKLSFCMIGKTNNLVCVRSICSLRTEQYDLIEVFNFKENTFDESFQNLFKTKYPSNPVQLSEILTKLLHNLLAIDLEHYEHFDSIGRSARDIYKYLSDSKNGFNFKMTDLEANEQIRVNNLLENDGQVPGCLIM